MRTGGVVLVILVVIVAALEPQWMAALVENGGSPCFVVLVEAVYTPPPRRKRQPLDEDDGDTGFLRYPAIDWRNQVLTLEAPNSGDMIAFHFRPLLPPYHTIEEQLGSAQPPPPFDHELFHEFVSLWPRQQRGGEDDDLDVDVDANEDTDAEDKERDAPIRDEGDTGKAPETLSPGVGDTVEEKEEEDFEKEEEEEDVTLDKTTEMGDTFNASDTPLEKGSDDAQEEKGDDDDENNTASPDNPEESSLEQQQQQQSQSDEADSFKSTLAHHNDDDDNNDDDGGAQAPHSDNQPDEAAESSQQQQQDEESTQALEEALEAEDSPVVTDGQGETSEEVTSADSDDASLVEDYVDEESTPSSKLDLENNEEERLDADAKQSDSDDDTSPSMLDTEEATTEFSAEPDLGASATADAGVTADADTAALQSDSIEVDNAMADAVAVTEEEESNPATKEDMTEEEEEESTTTVPQRSEEATGTNEAANRSLPFGAEQTNNDKDELESVSSLQKEEEEEEEDSSSNGAPGLDKLMEQVYPPAELDVDPSGSSFHDVITGMLSQEGKTRVGKVVSSVSNFGKQVWEKRPRLGRGNEDMAQGIKDALAGPAQTEIVSQNQDQKGTLHFGLRVWKFLFHFVRNLFQDNDDDDGYNLLEDDEELQKQRQQLLELRARRRTTKEDVEGEGKLPKSVATSELKVDSSTPKARDPPFFLSKGSQAESSDSSG